MRYIEKNVVSDLNRKMVFIGGPRQVGKTTLAQTIMHRYYQKGVYLNWDYDEHRQDILQNRWARSNDILVLDELHKHGKWKQWIKGVYDIHRENHHFLVTGSARLDVYQQGGDSLLGRYFYWRLHPFTLNEHQDKLSSDEVLSRLMTVGGFPEPFFDANSRESRRWRRERLNRVLREDIRDLKHIRNIQLLSLFLDMLRGRVGGLVQVSNMAGDLQISPKTARDWLELLIRMYVVFAVRPYTHSLPRAVVKPPKVYFFDNGDVLDEEGGRFENLVATSLLKRVHYLQDSQGFNYDLRYIRDKEGREVDFVILKDGRIEELIEVKYSDDKISRSLKYYAKKLNPKRAVQIVLNLRRPYSSGSLEVIDPVTYFTEGMLESR